MLGCYDFCGHYEWTFEWLRTEGGDELVKRYWREAIADDSQRHATEIIVEKGIVGMQAYWAHTLEEEGAGYRATSNDSVFRIDMHDCPSKGFLIRNHLMQYHDYCDHCIGWIGPLMERAGFVIDHQHNHAGQCWWEMRSKDDKTPPSEPGQLSGSSDVRVDTAWQSSSDSIDTFERATSPSKKQSPHH